VKQARAATALRAALFQEPPEAQMLRIAMQQAREAGALGDDLQRAEQVLQGLQGQEQALEALRKAAAARDVDELTLALGRCHEIGVARERLLTAVSQLLEEQAKIARVAGDHGLGSVVLADIERERRSLHNSILESYGGLRVACRIRPHRRAEHEPPVAPGVARVDRHTLGVHGSGDTRSVRFSAVFGPESIQAEVFSELRGLVQSAVDGYNVLLMAAGPTGGGKSFTMLGRSAEERGLMPRVVDALFAIRERDSWRAHLEVDAQLVEVYDSRKLADLLSRSAGRAAVAPAARLVPQAEAGTWAFAGEFAPAVGRQLVTVEGAVTRRAASSQELKKLLQDGYRKPLHPGRARHMVLLVTLTRTNRATGAMTRSKLALADLAGSGRGASPEVDAAYKALGAVFQSLARGDRRPPFRDHALTQLLQDCLGGSAKAALLLALPPEHEDRADSSAAIAFATSGSW